MSAASSPGRWVSPGTVEPQLPSSPMKSQASRAERALDGAFVNYSDAAKSYDCARETMGCDLILGVTLPLTPRAVPSTFQPSSFYHSSFYLLLVSTE